MPEIKNPYNQSQKHNEVMAKRFTDTEIWDKEWFMALKPKLKCLVSFVRDKCDKAGVWSPNWSIAKTYIGDRVTEYDLLGIDNGKQFMKLDDGRIFCVGFIEFQYGELTETCNPHKSIIALLKKYGLYERVLQGYFKGTSTLEDNNKTNIITRKEQEQGVAGTKKNPTVADVVEYFVKNGYSEMAGQKAHSYYNTANWHDSKGKKVLNWKQKMQAVWFKDENKTPEAPAQRELTEKDQW